METHRRKLLQACRSNGLKVTPQRVAVYLALASTNTHPTAEELRRRVAGDLPMISLDTVYRIVRDFAAIGLVRQVEGFQAVRFDAGITEHHHFQCRKCGGVRDIFFPSPVPDPATLEGIGTMENIECRLYGICENCKV